MPKSKKMHPPRSPGAVIGWKPQWERTLRYFAIAEAPGGDIERKQDEWLTFFLHCWHLSDHIRNDPALSESAHEACKNAARQRGSALAVCHDLAIAAKHFATFQPTDAQMQGHRAEKIVFSSLPVEERPGPDDPSLKMGIFNTSPYPTHAEIAAIVLVSYAGGREEAASDLARGAVSEWRAVLSSQGLIDSPAADQLV